MEARSWLVENIPDNVKNINAQHKGLKRPIITETLIKTEINFTDVSSLVLDIFRVRNIYRCLEYMLTINNDRK